MPRVKLFYDGYLEVDINGNPDNREEWPKAIRAKFEEALTNQQEDILASLNLLAHEIENNEP